MGLLDSLLDQDLTEINDLPTYEVPPNGFYKLRIKSVEEKMVTLKDNKGDAPTININFIVLEALELADPSEAEKVKENMEFSEGYMFFNDVEKTKSALKTTYADVGTTFGCKTLGEIVAKLPDLEVFATVKQRKDKNDPDKVYAQIRNVKVA